MNIRQFILSLSYLILLISCEENLSNSDMTPKCKIINPISKSQFNVGDTVEIIIVVDNGIKKIDNVKLYFNDQELISFTERQYNFIYEIPNWILVEDNWIIANAFANDEIVATDSLKVIIKNLGLYIDFPNCNLQLKNSYSGGYKDTTFMETNIISNPKEMYSLKNINIIIDDNFIKYSFDYQSDRGSNREQTKRTWDGYFEIDEISRTLNWHSNYEYTYSSGSAGGTLKDKKLNTSFELQNIPYEFDIDSNYIVIKTNTDLISYFSLISYSYSYNQFQDIFPHGSSSSEYNSLLKFINFKDQPNFKLIIFK